MTYTVKNGTWCKDNEKEYYSTTKTGLKAALKAGEISAGTRVVIHDPKYHAGQLIQSMNPNCPEGCFVPDGSAFDISIYTELAEVFPDGNLPDMRECVLVMVGQNTHIVTHNHDVFSAGEFKDDQAQLVEHDHAITDLGHSHGITDPGHSHGVTDPGHDHTIPCGGYRNIGDGGGSGSVYTYTNQSHAVSTSKITTGIAVDSATTGVSVNNNTTGISVNTKGNNNVTRTKQFGVYYYIAF